MSKKLTVAMALIGVVAMLFVSTGSAPAATQRASCSGACWTHLGGDPLFKGGLRGIAQRQHISIRQAFVFALTSSRGNTAMRYAGLDKAQRHAIQMAARKGKMYSCTMSYGMFFLRMSYGIHGTSVDRNVIFADPHYKNGASAMCLTATVDGVRVKILLPVKCANVGLVSKHRVHKKPPPPHVNGPAVSAQAQACVEEGGTSGTITGSVTNPNSKRYTIIIRLGGQTTTLVVPAGGSATFTLTGFAPGTYTGTATLAGTKKTAVFSVTVEQCAPPAHFTGLTCQGQEEVTGGASSKLVCDVTNDNGAEIDLSVQVLTNTGNLLVSGIQCSSQGGTPACKGSGTFEIRLKGVNDTSQPIYSELRVVATSNGVESDPFDQIFQIDPSLSNFARRR